jgi:hypothetical protein
VNIALVPPSSTTALWPTWKAGCPSRVYRFSRPLVASYAPAVSSRAAGPAVRPNVHPECRNSPRINDDGFEELCHLVTEQDPDTALCGKDVTGYPWDPPWPRCEACLAVARGEMN